MPTILDLTEEYQRLHDMLDVTEGEVTPEIDQFMHELERNLHEKADGTAGYLRFLANQAKACRQEAKRFSDRAAVTEKRHALMTARLLGALDAAGQTRLMTARNTISIEPAGGILALNIEDESKLPRSCLKTIRVPDTDEIRLRLQAGKRVRGASFSPRKRILRIR